MPAEYTPTQGFYLIDGTELVDVDRDLNLNLQRADQRVQNLISYMKTDVPTISTSTLPKEYGFKWYKYKRGAVWMYYNPDGPGNEVSFPTWANPPTFSASGITFPTNWSSDIGNKTVQCTDGLNSNVTTGTVRWRGNIKFSGTITPGTPYTVMNLPARAIPYADTNIQVTAEGNASPQFFRLLFKTTGTLEIVKYGATVSGPTIPLNNVRYPVNDVGGF
jgi:hypothetical protein